MRIVLSNKARFPGLMLRGEENPYPRDVAGIVFIIEDGTEYGTLTTETRRASGDFGAYSGVRWGAFGQGQGVGMLYDDDNGQREAGVFITDAPTTAAAQLLERGKAVQQMAEGPAKERDDRAAPRGGSKTYHGREDEGSVRDGRAVRPAGETASAAGSRPRRRATQRQRFEEISAERINIIEPNGTPRLILYNSSHTPGSILYGKDHPHPNRSPHAGMLYFNDEGTENGGSLDKSAMIELADTLQRPRLRMVVDSAGGARLEFLGDSGQVVRAITGAER